MDKRDLVAEITAYLSGGGLFNPELAHHDKVRDLLIACREELAALRRSGVQGEQNAGANQMPETVMSRGVLDAVASLPESAPAPDTPDVALTKFNALKPDDFVNVPDFDSLVRETAAPVDDMPPEPDPIGWLSPRTFEWLKDPSGIGAGTFTPNRNGAYGGYPIYSSDDYDAMRKWAGEQEDNKLRAIGLYESCVKDRERAEARAERMEKALRIVAAWELPPSGSFSERDPKHEYSYEAAFGSNGARDYMRKIARSALSTDGAKGGAE